MSPRHPAANAPSHHPPDEALLEFVAGTSTDGSSLAMACHVSLCAACAARASALEAVGGELLDAAGAVDLAPGALEATLARIDAPPETRDEARAPASSPAFLAGHRLPQPLLRRLAETAGEPGWRFLVPGVRVIDLASGVPGAIVRLVVFKAGITIPLHDHGGPEHIVVFTGALEEAGGRFARGDISIRAEGERHEQQVTRGEPCVALVVNEGKLKPLTLRGHLLLALSRD